MIITFQLGHKLAKADLTKPIDISLETKEKTGFKAWYSPAVTSNVIRGENFIGSVKEGGSVNFKEVMINPHANMTHTESVGHISKEEVPVNRVLNRFHFIAQLISVKPTLMGGNLEKPIQKGDLCILKSAVEDKINPRAEAIIIKTQPNLEELKTKNYDGTNWPYLHPKTAAYIREKGIRHLLIDQPSVDKEFDDGMLLSHRAFWNYPSTLDQESTITEFIGLPDELKDGMYLLNLSMSNLKNDASPSRPVLFSIFY